MRSRVPSKMRRNAIGKPIYTSTRLIVCGGHDYADRGRVWQALDVVHTRQYVEAILHTAAPGAETLASEWARSRGVAEEIFELEPHRGEMAPAIRARRMSDAEVTGVVVFPGAPEPTAMLLQARRAALRVWRPFG